MDQEALVRNGKKLVEYLDDTSQKPRAALWVYNPDNDIWRLWIVPSKKSQNEREFFSVVSDTITKHREDFVDFDISAVKLMQAKHPAIKGLSEVMHQPGLGSAYLSNNTLDGFYLPEGISLRMDL